MSNFSENNTHEENIQVSIDKILGSKSVIKRGRVNGTEKNKVLFYEVIDQLIGLDMRERELNMTFFLDTEKFNTPFYDVINALLSLHFSKAQVNLIKFYLYGRVSAEGFMIELMDPEGEIMELDTPEQLYQQLLKIK